MSRLKVAERWALHALTVLFVWVARRERVESVEEINVLGETERVWKVRSDGATFAQVTIFGTIIWNESRMNALSDTAKLLVLSHERSHKHRSPVFKGMMLGILLVASVAIAHLLVIGLMLVMGSSINGLAALLPVYAGIILLLVVVIRLDEFLADQEAIETVGENDFLRAYDELAEYSADSMLSNIVRRLLYTTPSTTARIYRARQKSAILP